MILFDKSYRYKNTRTEEEKKLPDKTEMVKKLEKYAKIRQAEILGVVINKWQKITTEDFVKGNFDPERHDRVIAQGFVGSM